MSKIIQKININTAVYLAVAFYVLVIALHILIISGVVPYAWVNGGRSDSMATQLPISIANIVISFLGGAFVIFVSRRHLFNRKMITMAFWLVAILWSFGLLQQLIGTPFERFACSFLLLLGVISHFRLAVEGRQ